jgi:D-inositol-3-phosphate glycosyltransferase
LAADVIVLPYIRIFQSGVLFLAYSFDLPVIATDVGSLKEEIIEGRTGFVCQPRDPGSIVATVRKYFVSNLYVHFDELRSDIRSVANDRHSCEKVGAILRQVYPELLARRRP